MRKDRNRKALLRQLTSHSKINRNNQVRPCFLHLGQVMKSCAATESLSLDQKEESPRTRGAVSTSEVSRNMKMERLKIFGREHPVVAAVCDA